MSYKFSLDLGCEPPFIDFDGSFWDVKDASELGAIRREAEGSLRHNEVASAPLTIGGTLTLANGVFAEFESRFGSVTLTRHTGPKAFTLCL